LSKYFSNANEKRNNEKIDIKTEGIKVNRAKTVIYFLLDFNPSLSMSVLIALLISKKINTKSEVRSSIFNIRRYCKFLSVNFINPLSIKVKNVKKPIDNVIINNIIK
jgi:hypothetical protein